MSKKKPTETSDEVENGVDATSERETATAEPAAAPAANDAAVADHRDAHGAESILGDAGQRDYHIWVDGQRYVHVGESGDRWVYRPD